MSGVVDAAVAALEELSSHNVLVRPAGVHAVGSATGPLAGTPIVVKDNVAVEGLPLTAGSPALEGYRPSRSATTVRRLLDAGAVVVGQTNMHELARGTTSHNAVYGPVRNPWRASRMAGGSSGGTAAAVAAGAVPAGLGTDTSGSGRIPAAMCGCVGFRASASRYPGDGVVHLSPSADAVTVMASTVEEVAVFDAVLAGMSESGSDVGEVPELPPLDPSTVRLGVPREACWRLLDPEVERVCEEALEKLRAAGVRVVDVDLDDLAEESLEVNVSMTMYEMYEYWSRFARRHLDCDYATLVTRLGSPDVVKAFGSMVDGSPITPDDYAALRALKNEVIARFATLFAEQRLDALVFPPVPVTAPEVGAETVTIRGREYDLLMATIANETMAPSAGLPAVSVPAGLAADGLPVGIELDGPTGSDRRLLAIAELVERCVGPLPVPR